MGFSPTKPPKPQTRTRKNRVQISGYRFYSPRLGRWLNRDPIRERGGLNVYGFVGNDPVRRIDFLGMADAEQVLALLRSVLSARKACSACPRVVAYMDCMEENALGRNRRLIRALDRAASSIGAIDDLTGNLETATEVLDYLQTVFDGQIVDPSRLEDWNQALGRAGTIVGRVSNIANIGASISRADALDLMLVIGSEFGPSGINSLFGYYSRAYRTALSMIEGITYSNVVLGKINLAASMCCEDCSQAEEFLMCPPRDSWRCWRRLR